MAWYPLFSEAFLYSTLVGTLFLFTLVKSILKENSGLYRGWLNSDEKWKWTKTDRIRKEVNKIFKQISFREQHYVALALCMFGYVYFVILFEHSCYRKT